MPDKSRGWGEGSRPSLLARRLSATEWGSVEYRVSPWPSSQEIRGCSPRNGSIGTFWGIPSPFLEAPSWSESTDLLSIT